MKHPAWEILLEYSRWNGSVRAKWSLNLSAAIAMNPDEIRTRVGQLRWHHSIELGSGILTPGQDNSARKLARLRLPSSLAGQSVLDVGAWDGFFSFEAERRDAQRVLATDSYVWNGSHDWASKQGFDLAKAALGSKVEELEIDVLELAPEKIGTFDMVLLLGVLYHMKHPLLALERVASVTGKMLILETVVDMLGTNRARPGVLSERRTGPRRHELVRA